MLAFSYLLVVVCSFRCTWTASVAQHEPHFVPDLRIHGGGVAKSHEYPPAVWMQISSTDPDTNQTEVNQCGGSLISPNYVLTAAHCLETDLPNELHDIVLGVHDFDDDKASDHQTFEVNSSNFIIHPSYNPKVNLFADIGLIKLPKSATIKSKLVELAKLPKKADASKSYVGQLVKAYGWGPVTEDGDVSDVLRVYQSKVISGTDCAKDIAVRNDNICTSGKDAKNNNVGICGGDSGGPLITSKKVLIGVVSRGHNCDDGFPSVFTNVGTYLTWIGQNSDAVIN